MTLLDLLDAACRDRRAAIALDGPAITGGAVTFEALAARSAALAADLAARGVRPGDRVALLLGNRVEVAGLLIAIWRLGAVALPLNTRYTGRELAPIVEDAAPVLLVHDGDRRAVVDEAGFAKRSGLALIDLQTHRPRTATAAPPPGRRIDEDAPALLLYTSGTTGRSKGAVLTHGNVVATIAGLITAWRIGAADRLLLTLPLFHTHGLVVGLLTTLAAGGTVVLHRRFDADVVAEALVAGEASLFYGVPTLYVRLAEALARRGVRSLPAVRLFCSGSAPLAPETFEAFRAVSGHEILERYGMTETGMNLANPYAGPRRPGTVGTPLPGVAVRIVDPRGAPVADGAEGELLVAGPHVFRGYLGDERKTRESFLVDPDGRRWFRTGDLARRDPSTGYVTLLGRRHELIISGGFNVHPREVEEVLEAHPRVAEAAVCGIPDAEWGERVVAFVVADENLDSAELAAWCRRRLAGFKTPRDVRRVAHLPRNAMGKLDRRALVAAHFRGDGSAGRGRPGGEHR